MSHTLPRAKSPSKKNKKNEHKVKFTELDKIKEKIYTKPPDIPRHTAARANTIRIQSSSSLGSLNNGQSSSRFNSLGRVGTNSLERSEAAKRSSPINRRRPGSVNRNKSNELSLAASDLKRSQSLEKKSCNKIWDSDTKIKRQDVKDIYTDKSRLRHSTEKLCSIERGKNKSSYFGNPILTQNGVNKSSEQLSSSSSSQNTDCTFRSLRRTVSKSPKRFFNKVNNEVDKENDKSKQKETWSTSDSHDKGRSSRREFTAEEKIARQKRL